MARIDLDNIAHSYDPQAEQPVYALEKCRLSWRDGGRYAVLGPSGCGKTTMLNIMSGIVQPSEGRILFDDEDVTRYRTAERNIAQVFQFPVIYNTMTVGQNLAFPLVCRDAPKQVITRKVAEVAETLGLENLLNRAASRLTADQKQLISLGRGLVRDDVAAILMDEPLTVIDPDLKFRLRRKLKEINEFYKSTLIYVTHDQNEAMTFANEIVVMDQGKVVQIGTPQELFERPQTTFVGYFIGAPAMNMFEVQISGKNRVKLEDFDLQTETDLGQLKTANIKLGIRSEFVQLAAKKAVNTIETQIERVDDLGSYQLVSARLGARAVKLKVKSEQPVPDGKAWLKLPAEHCCIYADEKLV